MSAKANSRADPSDRRLMTNEAWDALCESLKNAEQLVLGEFDTDSPRNRAEGFRYLARFLAAGNTQCVTHGDPDYPLFARMIDYATPWGLDNPDCLYHYASIRGDASYRITGNRGTANHIDIQANFGHFSDGDISSWGTISSIDGFSLETATNGDFELTLSPEHQEGNWLKLEPNAEFLLVRQYFNDWETESPAELFVERIGATYPIPPPLTSDIADRLEKLGRWLDRGGALWQKMSRGLLSMPPNSLIMHRADAAAERAGLRGQAYGMGNFRCRAGEAVIVELTPPICHHWSFGLANEYWEAIEYASRQSSLNGHQAVLDDDGVFRAVIAAVDPGVANWLDTAGHTQGTIAARFLRAEDVPAPTLRVVSLDSVVDELPPATPKIDPATRAALLERRRWAVWRRFRV